MNIIFLKRWTNWRLAALFSLILLFGALEPARARDHSPSHSSIPSIHTQTPNQAFATSPVFAENWVGSLFSKIEAWLRDRTHMIQFCAIAMVIGLLIIWWRKT